MCPHTTISYRGQGTLCLSHTTTYVSAHSRILLHTCPHTTISEAQVKAMPAKEAHSFCGGKASIRPHTTAYVSSYHYQRDTQVKAMPAKETHSFCGGKASTLPHTTVYVSLYHFKLRRSKRCLQKKHSFCGEGKKRAFIFSFFFPRIFRFSICLINCTYSLA